MSFQNFSDHPYPVLPRGSTFVVGDGTQAVMYQVIDNINYRADGEHTIGIVAQAVATGPDSAHRLALLVEQLLTNPTPAGEPLGTEPEILALARKVLVEHV